MGRFTPYRLTVQSLGRLRKMGKDRCFRCKEPFVVGQIVVPSGTRVRKTGKRNYYCEGCGKAVNRI